VTARRQRLSRFARRSDVRIVLGLGDFLKHKVDHEPAAPPRPTAIAAQGDDVSLIPIDKKPVWQGIIARIGVIDGAPRDIVCDEEEKLNRRLRPTE
jgi:hypothetical protein